MSQSETESQSGSKNTLKTTLLIGGLMLACLFCAITGIMLFYLNPDPISALLPQNTEQPTERVNPQSSPPEPRPTDVPLSQPPISVQADDPVFAQNNLGYQESGGIIIEVAHVLIAEKDFGFQLMGDDFNTITEFQDKLAVGRIILKVTNQTDQVLKVYPDQGYIIIKNEQIELFDYALAGAGFGEDIGGEIFPGVTQIGGLWFGIKRTPYDQVNQIVVAIDAPWDDSYDVLGDDFYFTIDLSDHVYEELPDELK